MHALNLEKYDFAIVGAGIAGISISELLTRSGYKVVLLEKGKYIGQEASADHHGWFHMGSLYSIFRKNIFPSTLIKGLENLIDYYSHFGGMNFFFDDNGSLKTKENNDTYWFTGKKINYYLACHNDIDFKSSKSILSYSKLKMLVIKIGWHMHVRKFIQRHKRFSEFDFNSNKSASDYVPKANLFDHKREIIDWVPENDTLINRKTHINIKGFDQTMRSKIIMEDLLSAFLVNGGELSVNENVIEITNYQDQKCLTTNNRKILADKVVLCVGKFIDELKLVNLTDKKISKMISPLAVISPCLSNENFVRMTPFVEKSINHLIHGSNSLRYSVVGGGYQLPEFASDKEKQEIKKHLYENIKKTFPNFNETTHSLKIYWGTKTEVISSNLPRNYQYNIEELDKNIWNAIPGKFSLGFSLAIETFRAVTGREPNKFSCSSKLKDFDSSIFSVPQTHFLYANKSQKNDIS
jgi:hypothetical protein